MIYFVKIPRVLFSILLFGCISFSSVANMAKPYIDGTESSTLFGSKNCRVLSEKIDLTATAPVDEDDYAYKVRYRISYRIAADRNGILPLLFIAQNMDVPKSVVVNGVKINLESLNKKTASQFKFLTPSQSGGEFYDIAFDKRSVKWGVKLEELIYFEATVINGENSITVEYDGYPEYNVYGLSREYKIQYALYPSNYWKSFGSIEVNINLPAEDKIRNVNMGKLQNLENGHYRLIINKITEDELKIVFAKKVSFFAEVLLFLQPTGLATIALLISAFFHFRWMKNVRVRRPNQFNYAVAIGTFLVSLIFYAVFIYSNELTYWATEAKGLKGGYVLLFIFTAPFFLIIYWIVMWIIDYRIKKKLNHQIVNDNGQN